jgi:hypothetical protein
VGFAAGGSNDPAAAGTSGAQPRADAAIASDVEPAERRAERRKRNPARTVRSLSLSQRDNAKPELVRFWCVKRLGSWP